MAWAKNGARCPNCGAPIGRVIRICKLSKVVPLKNGEKRTKFLAINNRRIRVRAYGDGTKIGCRFCARVTRSGNNVFRKDSEKAEMLKVYGLKVLKDVQAVVGEHLVDADVGLNLVLADCGADCGGSFERFFVGLTKQINQCLGGREFRLEAALF